MATILEIVPEPVASSHTMVERLGRWISVPSFLLAALAGFALSSVLGWLASGSATFEPFVRFHQLISGETFFQPTAMQLHQMVLRSPPGRILVIVGGSSRMYGVGQGTSMVWTNTLQQLLGNDYHVINLSLRGGAFDQFGMHAAEMAIRNGRSVIYVADDTDWNPPQPFGFAQAYRYFYFEASARNLLLDWEPRTAGVETYLRQASWANANTIAELRLRGLLNRFLQFTDLWTAIGYDYVFLPAWSFVAKDTPFRARRSSVDTESSTPSSLYTHLSVEDVVRRLRRQISGIDENIAAINRTSFEFVPAEIRRRMLVVAMARSPFYIDHLDSAERRSLVDQRRRLIGLMTDAGMTVIDQGDDWTAEDYIDDRHLSETGGRRLARVVAPAIRVLRARLGYLP
jgi:hypothetical protein